MSFQSELKPGQTLGHWDFRELEDTAQRLGLVPQNGFVVEWIQDTGTVVVVAVVVVVVVFGLMLGPARIGRWSLGVRRSPELLECSEVCNQKGKIPG